MPLSRRMVKTVRNTATAAVAATMVVASSASAEDTTLTVATVNNDDFIVVQKMTPEFEKAHPGVHIRWVTLEENVLRQRVTTDIATHAGQFDIVTIGNYEVPIWAKQNWLHEVTPQATYDVDDLLPSVRAAVTVDGKLYALPVYAESVMTYYRSDLFHKAGITMPENPTYAQIREYADKINDKSGGVYGLCLRGKPGWGESMAFIGSLVNTFGGQWFGTGWKPMIDSPAWKAAVGWYVSALQADGPPGVTSDGYNENLALFTSGRCGIWVDATAAAHVIFNPKESQVADKAAFAPVPKGPYGKGPTWLWTWNFAIPASTTHAQAAQEFITWATSKEYVHLIAQKMGWVSVPSGTRRSTYAEAAYVKAAPFAQAVMNAINTADPNGATAEPRPYTGAQFVSIPQFQAIGTQTGQSIAAALSGQMSVDQALAAAQSSTLRTMRQSGYLH